MDFNFMLPKVYDEETWKRNGSVPEHEQFIGLFYTSWSQIESFRDPKGFSTGLLGEFEYIKSYFFKQKFGDLGWGQHGTEVEAYICFNDYSKEDFDKLSEEDKENFRNCEKRLSQEELNFLKGIEPLGEFQREVLYKVEGLPVVVMGFIDDMTPPVDNFIAKVRDYKCKSKSSAKDLILPKKMQLEIYCEALKQRGYTVGESEYKVIFREFHDITAKEFMMKGGAEYLKCSGEEETIPYPRFNDPKRIKEVEKHIYNTCLKISNYYLIYKYLFKNDQN